MRHFVFLSLLLSIASIVSTVAVAKSVNTQHDREDQHNQASLQNTIPSSFLDIRSTSQQKSGSVPYGRDDDEKLIALCEAGFVTGCRQAIEGERTAASSVGKAQKSHIKTFLESALALLTPHSYNEEEKYVLTWGLFTFSAIIISVAVFCMVIAALGRDRWKCTAIVKDDKGFHDA
ncbi:hypothetical protein N7523_001135 [Penicillium sp. IBT 18751x]|nr:hypothetical protein N7523_001135 [Penicillium sp. IBT 18751x]